MCKEKKGRNRMIVYCSRYEKECIEAVYHNCDVPSDSYDIDEQVNECKNCEFCEEKDE